MSAVAIIIVILGVLSHTATSQFNMKEYWKMPPMYHFDDYERCLVGTDDLSIFCIVHAVIKPDNESAVYKQVIEFSNDTKKHFNHDLLYYGYCLDECEDSLRHLSEEEREDLYVEPFPWRLQRKWYEARQIYANTSRYRKLYDKTFNQCMNLWMQNNYNLSVQSTINFCSTNQDAQNQVYDHWHYLFIVFSLSIVVLAICGTSLDMRLNSSENLEHYKKEIRKPLSNQQEYLLCFSTVRNWYRLMGQPTNELGKNLKCLNTFRYLTVIIFMLGHLLLGYAAGVSVNPEFIEVSYHKILLGHTTTPVQMFFFVSGFLLFVTIKPMFKRYEFNVKYVTVGIIYRYIRLTPPIAFLVLYNASFLADSGEGPFWKYFGESEKTYCRTSWWTNLLYINNVVNTDDMCMIHTWYVAADTQLFILTLLICMVMFKYWRFRKRILAAAIFTCFVLHSLSNYLTAQDGIHLFTPEAKRTIAFDITVDTALNYFVPQTNTVNYLLGVCGAMLYFKVNKSQRDFRESKVFILIWYLTLPAALTIMSVSYYIFYNYNFDLPSVWVSVTEAFLKSLFGIYSISLVMGFTAKFKSVAKNFCHCSAFTPLSRLTYCIYLCHLSIVRPLLGTQYFVPHLTLNSLVVQMIALCVLSHLVAMLLCLFLEFPMTAMAKKFLRKSSKSLEMKNLNNNQINELLTLQSNNNTVI